MLLKDIKYTIAKWLFFIPDKLMLKIQYWFKTGKKLNLKEPTRFSEKIQYYKIYYHNENMKRCVDKYDVRAFVKEKLGTDKYLNTLYQVCPKADMIDFDSLPDKFVIKTTDGGDGANVLVCTNKSQLNINETIKKINRWRNKRYDLVSREWAYKGARDSKVIVEKYLEDNTNTDGSINDYKFLCFNGKFRFLWVDKDRFSTHKRGFWDENLKFLKNVRSDCPTFEGNGILLPENIHEMISLSEELSKGFPFARIDWYNIKGKIIFGEITFYPWSGYVKYTPDSFDFELGKYFVVNENMANH